MKNLMNINEEVKMSSLEIAEICGKRHDHVIRDIRNMVESIENIDCPQIWGEYKDSTGRALPCAYLDFELTTTLMTGYRVDLRHKVVQRWMELEKREQKPKTQIEVLMGVTQVLVDQEKQLQLVSQNQEKQAQELQEMRNVVALNPIDWRRETEQLMKQIALKLGGFHFMQDLRVESYRLLDERMGVCVQTRLTNKKRRMAEEGICKSKRDRLNPLDVIGDDKKLVEGYVAIIKEQAIRYGVGKPA